MHRASDIAHEAANLIATDRQDQHGDPGESFKRIAELWTAYLRIRRDPAAELTSADAATMMTLMKISRTQCGGHNPDDYTDAIGYVALAGDLAERERDT